MKWILLAALSALFLLTACQFSAEQREALGVVLNEMLADGRITQTQYEALMGALTQGNWQSVLGELANIGIAIGGSLLGVRVWRGGIASRKGELPVTQA